MSSARQTAARARVARGGSPLPTARAFASVTVFLVAAICCGVVCAGEGAHFGSDRDEEMYLRDNARIRTYRSPIYHGQARVIKYDMERDDFLRNSSVLMPAPEQQPQQGIAYYGNRLTQYRYMGPTERGGIYSALVHDKVERKLDAKKYRYRWDW